MAAAAGLMACRRRDDGAGPLPLPHRRRGQRVALALQPHLNHVRAAVVVVIEFLTVHAVDALVDVDVPSGWIACTGHSLAQRWQGEPHSPALQPLEHADAPGMASAAPSGHR
jgi:hypothetical protein